MTTEGNLEHQNKQSTTEQVNTWMKIYTYISFSLGFSKYYEVVKSKIIIFSNVVLTIRKEDMENNYIIK